MNWLSQLKEYAPSIAGAILSGGATLPQLALKAISDATGVNVLNETDLADMVESASPEVMLKLKQANNSFKIRMRELDNELVSAELSDMQDARKNHKHSIMPAILCCVLTVCYNASRKHALNRYAFRGIFNKLDFYSILLGRNN